MPENVPKPEMPWAAKCLGVTVMLLSLCGVGWGLFFVSVFSHSAANATTSSDTGTAFGHIAAAMMIFAGVPMVVVCRYLLAGKAWAYYVTMVVAACVALPDVGFLFLAVAQTRSFRPFIDIWALIDLSLVILVIASIFGHNQYLDYCRARQKEDVWD